MDTFTQIQLETAEAAMDTFTTLPGTDPSLIAEGRPSVETMAETIESKMLIHPDIETSLLANYPSDFVSELQETELIPINEVSRKEVPGGNGDLKRHWKKLIKEMPKGATMQHLGGRVVFSYPIVKEGAEGDSASTTIIVNLSGSSKKDGLLIENHFQTNPDNEVWDSSGFVPENTQIFFRNHGLMVKILRPWYAATAGASIRMGPDGGSRKIELYRIKALDTVGGAIAHEGYHIDDFDEYPADIGWYSLTRMGLRGSNLVGGAAWILKQNPLYMLPHVIAALGLYGMSRDPKTAVGSGFHSLLRTESGAYLFEAMLHTALENKGFILEDVNNKHRMTLERPISKSFVAMVYEPPLWAIIDLIRIQLEKSEDLQPVPAVAHAM